MSWARIEHYSKGWRAYQVSSSEVLKPDGRFTEDVAYEEETFSSRVAFSCTMSQGYSL